MAKTTDYLPNNTRLDQIQIAKVIGGGGFSIVYLGKMIKSGETVAIKEYFPAKLAKRGNDMKVIAKDEESETYFKQGRKLFFQEASILASLEHENIVKILGFVQANGTIYSAMHYHQGLSLQAYIKKQGKHRSEKFIRSIFIPILEGLKAVHEQGLLHLDIKPGNIYLRQSASPIILDFGAAHKLALSADSRMFPVVSHGFSPPEQSKRKAKLGPWSDMYAIGATIRSCIEAKPPPSAKERVKKNNMLPAAAVFCDRYSKRF
ncbi:MAG TPA: serine/threonine protein kinase, partial [Gammaproteobacteria bacterium]|nr:serine/threonine protein kinase [Gammaproteobacteria bacterium]